MENRRQTIDEFLEILRDVHEQVSYARELGVYGAEMNPDESALATGISSFPETESLTSHPGPVKGFGAAPKLTAAREVSSHGPGALLPQISSGLPQGGSGKAEALSAVRREIGDCQRCDLCRGRQQVVHSHGNVNARLMFVGEAPGADEDRRGVPFVGRAGQLLDKIIDAIGMKREQVFVGNINRCRPPANRTPTFVEALQCRPFLLRDIEIVKPEVIVLLGNTALKNLLEAREGITRLRGAFQEYQGIKVMPTYHPAYLLRYPNLKRETWADMKKVRDYLDETAKGAGSVP